MTIAPTIIINTGTTPKIIPIIENTLPFCVGFDLIFRRARIPSKIADKNNKKYTVLKMVNNVGELMIFRICHGKSFTLPPDNGINIKIGNEISHPSNPKIKLIIAK